MCRHGLGPGLHGGPIALDKFASAYAAAVCDGVGPCCLREGTPYERTTCYENAKALFSASIANRPGPNIRYDASAARDCVNASGAAFRTCEKSTANAPIDACERVFVGTLPAGAPCNGDGECAVPAGSHVTCTRDAGSPGGAADAGTAATTVCVVTADFVATSGKAGEACTGDCLGSGLDATCASSVTASAAVFCHRTDGLYCAPESLKCTPHVGVGAACSTYSCAVGTRCDSGTCVAQRDTGPCVSSPDACLDSTYCDVTADRCTPKLPDGQPCPGGNASCQSGYCEDGLCATPKFTSPHLCDGTDMG